MAGRPGPLFRIDEHRGPGFREDHPTSSAATRTRLGWEPTHRPLLDDIRHGSYVPA